MLQPPLDDPEDPGASLCAKPVTLRQILPQQGELFYLLLGSLAPTRVVSGQGTRLFWWVGVPLSRIHTAAFMGEYHFRYLKCLMSVGS